VQGRRGGCGGARELPQFRHGWLAASFLALQFGQLTSRAGVTKDASIGGLLSGYRGGGLSRQCPPRFAGSEGCARNGLGGLSRHLQKPIR